MPASSETATGHRAEPRLFSPPNPDQFLDDRDAASLLGLSAAYMRQMRTEGGGPRFSRLAARRAVRYRYGDLMDWARSKSATSTSELDAVA